MEETTNSSSTIAIIDKLNKKDENDIVCGVDLVVSSDNNNSHKSTFTCTEDNSKAIASGQVQSGIGDVQLTNDIERENVHNVSPKSSSTPLEESVANASTEVLLDASISERLEELGLCGDEPQPNFNNSTLTTAHHDEKDASLQPNKEEPQILSEKLEKDTEKSRLILSGELSDNSECSVEVEEEEPSDYVNDKVNPSDDISDEEMFIEDQDDDVEEEEEFHEVEEEKHKASQESVDYPRVEASSANLVEAVEQKVEASTSRPEIFNHVEVSSSSVDVVAFPEEDPESSQTKKLIQDESKPTTQVIESSCEPTIELENHGGSNGNVPEKNADWTDIMLSSNNEDSKNANSTDQSGDANATEVQDTGKDEDKKELDLDEDVKNPQYIPKKGVFYEHDDRSHEANSKKPSSSSLKNEDEVDELKDSPSNKKIGIPEKPLDNRRNGRRQRTENDRWNHDLFKDEKQKPKSKNELINAYGYDIRQERSARTATENRPPRSNNNTAERQQNNQDNQRSRPTRDNRTPRQSGGTSNRSRDRRSRRPNNRNRTETSTTLQRRDGQNTRAFKLGDIKQEPSDLKQNFTNQQNQTSAPASRREYQEGNRDHRNARYDIRGRRQNSRDRPTSNSNDDKLPPITTVMPPITTWSNQIEDMVKEEAIRKDSPNRQHQPVQNNNASIKSRPSNDQWPQSQQNKTVFSERSSRNLDEGRQQPQYTTRRHQDREETHKPLQFVNRNQFNERSSQHHSEWRRNNHYNNTYAKSSEYEPIKTQTFENSRLSQNSVNRSHFREQRDARELINERRLQNQHNFQVKTQTGAPSSDHQLQQQQQLIRHHHSHQSSQQQQQIQHHQQQQIQQQHLQHNHHQQHLVQQQQQLIQHQQLIQQQNPQHLRQHQHQHQPQQQHHPQQQPQQSTLNPAQQSQTQSQVPPRQQPAQQPLNVQGQHQSQRQTSVTNSIADNAQESSRISSTNPSTSDLINSRPIVKTDAYTSANVAPISQQAQPHLQQQQHQQPQQQNHRSIGGSLSQQGPNAATHILPSHLGTAAGSQAQYYPPSANSRDSAAAAALASAYHGYIPSGHSVMDTARYHMASQQLPEHSYMTSPAQTNDVTTASVLHPQGIYTDAPAAGGTVASSAYLAQAGSTLSPSTNIPVTGAGPPPLAPVSYLQHSQYAPPPYSNPYSQPQHNQAPPQSAHAYPYWTYI